MRRGLLLGLLLALAGGAFAEAASAPTITLKLDPKAVFLGHKVEVHGRLATQDKREVTLYASRFPFKHGFSKVSSEKSDGKGFYLFDGHPTLANRLRVHAAGGAHSRVRTVYVLTGVSHGTCSFKTQSGQVIGCNDNRAHGKLTLRIGYYLHYPKDAYDQESSKPVYVYYGQRNGSQHHPDTLHLQKTVAQNPIGKHRTAVHATVKIDAPQGQWSYYYSLCTRSTEHSDGLGVPGHHGCGQQDVTYAQATSYKFS